jgi:hypothetical protein
MNNFRSIFIGLFFILSGTQVYSQSETTMGDEIILNNFIVKEDLLKNNRIAIIAADSLDKPLENLSGTFQFSINGFGQELKFNNGVAVAAQPIDKSTFIYLRHENETGTHGKLYYVIRKGDYINPIKISWWVLVVVPLILIILATLFRKFIIIAGILLVFIFYYNSSKGLKLPTFFETVFDGLKNLI